MLTLFPRIRPNPIPPPPMPVEPPAPKTADASPEAVVPIAIEAPTQQPSLPETAIEPVSTYEPSTTKGAVNDAVETSISDSDVFSAFLSGMASGNPEPFIVEISGKPAEPKKTSEVSQSESQSLAECAVETAANAAPTAEEAVLFDAAPTINAVAATHEPEPVSEAIPIQEDTGNTPPRMVIAGANIFDELDILHEATTASTLHLGGPTAPDTVPEMSPAAESQNSTSAQAAEDVGRSKNQDDDPHASVLAPTMESPAAAANENVASIPRKDVVAEDLIRESASGTGPPCTAPEEPTNIRETKVVEAATAEDRSTEAHESKKESVTAVAPPSELSERVYAKASNSPSSRPVPKPRRAKGTLFGLARVPEPETMDDSDEVEAYASAAAQAHLDAIDDTFVAHAQLLLKGRERGRILDIGTGPGQIVIKLGYRLTRWKFVGIDRSATMIEKAVESLATAGELAGRVEFRVADGNALDFPDKSFEMVVCNSVLHHIHDPQKLFSEIARVVKPGGAILLRDLRRPSRPGYAFHVWKHGKHYSGEMRRLFIASVQAAYTEEELQKIIAASRLRDVRVFRHGKTHIGFDRPLAASPAKK